MRHSPLRAPLKTSITDDLIVVGYPHTPSKRHFLLFPWRGKEPASAPAKLWGALVAGFSLLCATAIGMEPASAASSDCGEVATVETHGKTTTRYALQYPAAAPAQSERIAMVLLVGGGGHLNLDHSGCPRALKGNSLVRSLPYFWEANFVTALVDAPSDHSGEDGLAGFRVTREHAEDLGKVIADVRTRAKAGAVWLIGTSRGSISAVNAAARLSANSAPDGLVLTSALMSGTRGAQKRWVAQTVFDLHLEMIRLPLLVIGHVEDKCIRSPAGLMDNITARTNGTREQVVSVTGGPGYSGPADINACEGRAPHGFVEQEAEVSAGIARFIRGGVY